MSTNPTDSFASSAEQVANLSQDVHFLKSKIDSRAESARSATVDSSIVEEVIALTRSLFGGDVQIEEEEDPEITGDRYAMVYAQSRLSDDEIDLRQTEWQNSVRAIAHGKHGYFRLFVDAR